MDYERRKQKLIEDRKKKSAVVDLPSIFREHGLPYLPAKSLHRFKSVCSIWKFWIGNPFFSHRQSYSFRALSGVFYQNLSSLADSPRFLSLDPSAYGVPDPSLGFLPEPVRLKQSSSGMVCCWSPQSNTLYVCNPVSRQWRAIPKSPREHGRDPDVVLKLEPGSFNFDAEFEIICTFASSEGEREFDIFSSKSNSWKLSRELMMQDYAWKSVRGTGGTTTVGVYANKVAYWRMHEGCYLLAFDFVKERASLVRNPEASGRLGELGGELCHAVCHSGKLALRLLSSPSSGWSKPAEVSLHNVAPGLPRNEGQVLAIQGEDVVVYVDGRILKYNTISGSFTIQELPGAVDEAGNLLLNATVHLPYINTLVPLLN
ncbi:hypothetical protein H6P81_021124 [Aristolochia fimbriata]|uniref:F-box associated beta-propeller type 1 domain-containing protein n=1 Tax=Aristolochia fimbriata TaxID=158543 RepID=A0AAV7DWQ9_ARIFI|nr:hypothetical protein H6P81_021124 [Aristolochia fimbriata]